MPVEFEFEVLPDLDAVRAQIQECEGRCVQQAFFSTYMDALTQICFTCRKVRSTYYLSGQYLDAPSDPGRDLIAKGIEAFRLTREYLGEDVLPELGGWSWFDWVRKAEEYLDA